MYPSHTRPAAEDADAVGPIGSIRPFRPTDHPGGARVHRDHLGQRLPERTSKRVGFSSPFLTQAATYTTRPSPTTHGSTTNTSRPAAVVEVAAVASPPPAEPSRSPLRSETPTSTPTCRCPSPTHRAAEDTRRPIGPTGSIPPSRPMDHPHGGTQVTGTTSVNDFLSGQANRSVQVHVALLDPSGNLHNPPVTHDAWINYQYQSPGGGGGGGGGGQSPTGGTIVITAPVGNADQHADLHVSISYASGEEEDADAQLGLPDRFGLPGLWITPRRNPSHRNHLGQRLPERTSKRVRRPSRRPS